MRKIGSSILVLVISVFVLQGCGAQAPTVQPQPTAAATETPLPATPEATATATSVPSPTPLPSPTALPGSLVLPVDTLAKEIPWLPLDTSARPRSYFFYFNFSKPPFNNLLVRQAFAAATDREALTALAQKYGAPDAKPATTLTPPETLGRDLYNQVGIPFDPARAKDLLLQAGYTDPTKFPAVTLLTNATGDPAPGVHQKIAEALVKMWKEYLGVTVTFQVVSWSNYQSRLASDPSEIVRLGWAADYNDPDDFLWELFRTGGPENYGHFSDADFDQLVERAKASTDPAERQQLYIQAERILCETQTALIPIYTR